jgi:hypothetical protein
MKQPKYLHIEQKKETNTPKNATNVTITEVEKQYITYPSPKLDTNLTYYFILQLHQTHNTCIQKSNCGMIISSFYKHFTLGVKSK